MDTSARNATVAPNMPVKLPYEAPQLQLLGDVRDLTLGGTDGTGDSGPNAGTQRF
jgi:hypothetical protein